MLPSHGRMRGHLLWQHGFAGRDDLPAVVDFFPSAPAGFPYLRHNLFLSFLCTRSEFPRAFPAHPHAPLYVSITGCNIETLNARQQKDPSCLELDYLVTTRVSQISALPCSLVPPSRPVAPLSRPHPAPPATGETHTSARVPRSSPHAQSTESPNTPTSLSFMRHAALRTILVYASSGPSRHSVHSLFSSRMRPNATRPGVKSGLSDAASSGSLSSSLE